MKKLLTTLSTMIITISPISEVISCYNPNNAVQKKPITEENLRNFFEQNNTYEYTGEYFFKDESKQSEVEDLNFLHLSEYYLDKLISDSFSKKFNNEFSYNSYEYNLNIWEGNPSWTIKGIKLNNLSKFIFRISLYSVSKEKIIFESKDLTFNFFEISQYNNYDWFINNINFWKGDGRTVFANTMSYFAGYKHMILEPFANYKTDEEKNKYKQNNNKFVLDGISNQYTKTFSTDTDDGYWLYEDKKMSIISTKYEYLGNIPNENIDYGVRSKTSLKFTSLSDNSLSTEESVDLWMQYIQIH